MTNDNQKKQPIDLDGNYRCTLDAKKRLKVPAPFINAFPAEAFKTVVISKAKDRCLNLYTKEEYDEIKADLASRPPSAERREIMRYLSIASRHLTVDGHGRVLIPPEFLAMIGNAKELVVLGVGEHMEIWNAEDFGEMFDHAWETYRKSDFER